MQSISEGMVNVEAIVDENFQTLQHLEVYGKNPETTTGLTWGYYGGRWGGVLVAAGTLTLTDSATNYVVVHRTTAAISVSTTTTNWNDVNTYARVYKITTSGGQVSATPEDHRAGSAGVHGLGVTVAFTGGTLSSPINLAPPATLASASSMDIGAASANVITVTGSATINTLGTIAAGAERTLVFTGAPTIVNSANIILPGATNLAVSAGDAVKLVSEGSNVWRCIGALFGAGLAGAAGTQEINSVATATYTVVSGDRGKLIAQSHATSLTLSLPASGGTFVSGWFVDVAAVGDTYMTITPNGSDPIDGSNTPIVIAPKSGMRLISTGSGWVTNRGSWRNALALASEWTKAQSVKAVALTSGATVAIDASLSNNFKLVLAHNAVLQTPTNYADGKVINIVVKQPASGGPYTLGYVSSFKFPGGVPPVASTAANAVDLLSCYFDSDLNAWLCNMSKGFA